jgi:hypothetical protein
MTTTEATEFDDEWDGLAERSTVALFAGDEGGLSLAQRRCLVSLLKHRYLSRRTHPELWDVLIEHQALMRSRLNDLFLTLHVDAEGEVAYKRQAVPDSRNARFPTLLHDTAYSREETVLLVYLRERMQRERASGAELVLVDREDLLERVAEFRSPDATDLAGERRRAEIAIESLRSMRVLHDTRDHDRLTVSPVLDSLMPLARLQELLDWLRTETGARQDRATHEDESDDEGDKPGATEPVVSSRYSFEGGDTPGPDADGGSVR